MNALTVMVNDCRNRGIIDPSLVAEQVASNLMSMSKTQIMEFVRPLLPESVRAMYSRERLGLPVKADNAARSGKVTMIRDYYGKVIGLPSGEWKRIGDCTRPDLIDYSGLLHGQAAKTEAKARWYESLAEQLPDDMTTVQEAALDLSHAA